MYVCCTSSDCLHCQCMVMTMICRMTLNTNIMCQEQR